MNPKNEKYLDGVDRFIKKCMKDWDVPGLALGIINKNRIVYLKGYGTRDMKRSLPVEPGTHFGVGSCTKSFTATAIGILVDEGKLEWDTPVRQYLPHFKMKDAVATERLTPRDLLTHRSGLPQHDFAFAGSSMTRDEVIKRLRYLDLNKDFRTVYQYNNLMYLVTGALIEHVTHLSWEQFINDRLFKPLGMNNSYFFAPDLAENGHLAIGYEKVKNKLIRWDRGSKRGINARTGIGPCGPAGSIISNGEDMCRWLKFQMSRGKVGGQSIITEQSLNEIHTPQVVDTRQGINNELFYGFYALGWNIRPYRGYQWIRHGGQYGGFNADASFMPTESTGVIVLTNIMSSPLSIIIPLNIYDRIMGLDLLPWNARCKRLNKKDKALAEKKNKKTRGAGCSKPLKDYTGIYFNPGYGSLVISLEKRQLALCFNLFTFRLKHKQDDVFEMNNPIIGDLLKASFKLNKRGMVESIAIPFEPTVKDIIFKKRKTDNC